MRLAPKLTVDAECVSRASRAVASMALARRAAASEVTVPSGIEHETWMDGYRSDDLTAAGWITVAIMTCCTLGGLLWVWWKSGRVAETVSNGTQTLEEGGCAQDIPTRVTITKHGKAAQCRYD